MSGSINSLLSCIYYISAIVTQHITYMLCNDTQHITYMLCNDGTNIVNS